MTYLSLGHIVSPMNAIFIADAHLCKPSDTNYRLFMKFLDEQLEQRVDVLVLLGDIFEFWIGKKTVLENYAPVIDILEKYVLRGTKLIYVEGNHDFHLGPIFSERLKCRILPDGGNIKLDEIDVFIAHGDLVDEKDIAYRTLRKILRSGLIRFLIRTLPERFILKIASRASHESRKKNSREQRASSAEQIIIAYAEKFILQGSHAVVTGHFHQPFHKKVGDGELIALGDWITQFSYCEYRDQKFTLKTYSNNI